MSIENEKTEYELRVQRELDLALEAGIELSEDDMLSDKLNRMERRNSKWMMNSESERILASARNMRNNRPRQSIVQGIPLVCRAEQCPFNETCPLFQADLAPKNERCPIEIAAIEDLFDRYCNEFGIRQDDEGSTVDLLMVKELVDTDIMLVRCDNKLAIDADFIVENVVGQTQNGDTLVRKELHTASTYKEMLRNSKYKTLQLLNATRKDKDGHGKVEKTEQERIAEMMALMQATRETDRIEAERKSKFLGKSLDPIHIPDASDEGVIEAVYVEEEEE